MSIINKDILDLQGLTTYDEKIKTEIAKKANDFVPIEYADWLELTDAEKSLHNWKLLHVPDDGPEPVPDVPDGKTVTPTDDVEIWLKCAGIEDSGYTTLAEVMADTGVLSALIADSNAVDYLVRSKTFAKSEALVPAMTSDTTPSGRATASAEPSSPVGTKYAYMAFDNDTSSFWADNANLTKWVGYEFATPTTITKLYFHFYNLVASYLENNAVELLGSNDNVNFTSIKQVSKSEISEITAQYTTDITSSASYKYYRLAIHNTVANATFGFYTVQFYSEEGLTDNQTAMSYIGLNNYASNTLLADSTWCEAICNSTYFESVLNVKVPAMTSNTTPSGEVSAQSYYSEREPYLAFDGNSSTRWNGSTIVSVGQSISEWIKYKFTQRVSIKRLSYNYNSANTTLIILEGSNDNSTFREVARCSNVSQGGYTYAFTNPDDYQYYRLTQTQTNNTTGSAALPTAIEIQLYGRADI